MNGMAAGMEAFITQTLTSHISHGLPNPNEHESYACPGCGKTIDRKKLTFASKDIYVFPACSCMRIVAEQEIKQKERRMLRDYVDRVYSQNLMSADLVAARFETFILRPGTELCFRDAKEFADNFDQKKTGIMLWGIPGNGKSHLSASIHHRLDGAGHVCLFLEVQRLCILAEESRKYSNKTSLNDIINAAIQCDLLTLDELGAEKVSSDDYKVLFSIINGRQGKKTNYTSNLDLDELQEYFKTDKYNKPLDTKGRLLDRVLGSCTVIQNHGTSKRQEDALKRLGGA